MSILTTAALVAATAAVGAYAAGNFMSKSIVTEIEIDAPVETVWQTLADTESYSDWNPFVKRLEGDWVVGNTLGVTVQAEGQNPMDFTPEVLVASDGKELRWVGKFGAKGFFDGEHYFIFEETEDGKTLFRHGEDFRGMLVYVLFPLIAEGTGNGFRAMNEALKVRAEAV